MKRSIIILLSLSSSLGAVLFQHLPFTISTKGIYLPQGRFFIGAGQTLADNTFSLAAASRNAESFVGLTPKKVTLNNVIDQDNPLNGASIVHLAMLERRPVVISQKEPSSLFLVDDLVGPIKVFSSEPLKDAQGNVAPSLLALATTAQNVSFQLDAGASLGGFAALPNQQGGFDGSGSGIAFSFFRQSVGTKALGWDLIDATTGKQGNVAAPFGVATPELFIGSPAGAIDSLVALHFDRDMGLLYIGVDAQSAAGANTGVRAVVVALTVNGKIIYRSIAPDSAFNDMLSIVGSRGAGSQVRIFKIDAMQTRTHLRYLIVAGGNGDDPTVQQSVFALPLVDNRASAAHGTLANVYAPPVTLFGLNAPHRFLARVYNEPATQPNQLYKVDAPQARVGGRGSLPGPIRDLSVAGEAIFVACDADQALNSENLASGIFVSQPVFDVLGRISGWTDWQRVSALQNTNGFEYDSIAGSFWSVVDNDQVTRTGWSNGSDPLELFMAQQFSKEEAGVQGLFDFSYATQGFSQIVNQRLSLTVATGFSKVLLIQSGKDVGGLFGPFINLSDLFSSTDGSLTGFKGASALSLSGGALNELGPITSATIVTDDSNGWLVVAGSKGVAVLTDSQGRGWPIAQGLRSGFAGLSDEFSWTVVRSTENVRKLISQSGFLYILALKSLERVSLSQSALVSKQLQGELLYEVKTDTQLSLSDLFIKGPLALLATSFGLLRSGSGISIETVQPMNVGWASVALPESAGSLDSSGPVSRLYAVRTSGQDEEDMVYILNGYVGLSQALIYRSVIKLEGGQVTDTSVQLFPDFIVRGKNTFFANVADYRNFVATDGSFIALSRSSFGGKAPLLELLSPTLKSGESTNVRANFPFLVLSLNEQALGQLVRNSASGAFMVPGDFGVRLQK